MGCLSGGAVDMLSGAPSRFQARPRNCILLVIVALALGIHHGDAGAADMVSATFTPVKGPDCVIDTSKSFLAQDVEPPPNPPLPLDRFFLVVRHMGRGAVATAPAYDFSRIPADYAWPPARGLALTGFAVPDPKPLWQRSNRADATADNASAFQLHCYDVGSFINTWTFPDQPIIGGGPHAIYGYSFGQTPLPAIFDGNPDTDFVLQASIEIPWFVQWPDTSGQAQFDPVGQVNLFAYFRDRFTGKPFALLLAIFDNRAGTYGSYAPSVAHDGATPFASTPLNAMAAYVTLSPYSSTYTGVPWSGLRFFRGHITPRNFREAIDDINAYCAARRALPFCSDDPRLGVAYGLDSANYELTDFGVLHEVFRGGANGNLSMGVHIFDLGAWNAH
jgi:hypothetical protein